MRRLAPILGSLGLGVLAACGSGGSDAIDDDAGTPVVTGGDGGSSTSSSSSSSSGSSGTSSSSSGGSSGAAPTCSDGAKNGSETDVDCGGSCAPCALGKACTLDADCATGACNTACIPKPTLTAVLPACGALAGGTAVKLLGTGFVDKPGWTVTFGASTTAGAFMSPTTLSATAPAGAAGKVAVSIVGMPGGTLTLANAFSYVSGGTAPTFGTAVSSGYSGSYALAVGDVNGDGKIDYIEDHGTSHLDLMINNGTGSFTLTSHSASRGQVRRMVMADFNGDAKLDLVMTAPTQVGVALNSGTTFGTRTDLAGSATPEGVVAVDLTGDGKPEIVTIDSGADVLSVFKNKGDGTFDAKVDYVAPKGTTVAAADFDGDGKMDIVSSSSAGNVVAVFLGNGDGTLDPAVTYPLGATSAGLVVADINADGKADIVAASGGNVSVLFGKGDGTFLAKIDTPIPGASGAAVLRVSDFDGDGTADIAVLNQAAGRVELWLNLCDGTFVSSGVTFANTGAYDLFVADVSGDGKLDVLYSSSAAQPRYNAKQ